jgi:glycosyltransferase involved in cell wall biosynthesis
MGAQMKIVLITHGVFLDPACIASGNSVRAYYLAKGLVHSGHEVTYVFPRALEKFSSDLNSQPEPGIRVRTYDGREELARLIGEEQPDVLLVGYWELLDELPDVVDIPVVLDVVAPRVLEAMFQQERDLGDEVRRMLTLYRKADRFLAGTERQRHFLLPWLIMAGFDCRYDIPVDVVPISVLPGKPLAPKLEEAKWRFVSGGVSWPWRRTERWFDEVVRTLRARSEGGDKFVLFAGKYIYSGENASPDAHVSDQGVTESRGLLAYGEMQRYLAEHCDVGIELADRNVEREYSQSFRAMEFLRAGLPLICNDYLELAPLIEQYDAGWVVHSSEEVPVVLRAIMDDGAMLARKSANAIRLVEERFHYLKTVKPVAAFVALPEKAKRNASVFAFPAASAVVQLPQPALLRRILGYLKRRALPMLRGLARALRPAQGTKLEIAIVSRADVFPPDHGSAVKIERTAVSLSRYADAIYLITDDRRHYYIYRDGVAEQKKYPLWLSWLAPLRLTVRARALARGIPPSDAFLYYPLFDWSFITRTLYLGLRHPISVFQAESAAYARACLWGRSLFGGRVVVVEHNVEYQRLRDQVAELSPLAFDFLRHVEVQLCNQSDAVVAVSERDRKQLVEDGVIADYIHYIPLGVDIAQFDSPHPIDVRACHGIGREELVLVYHGTYMYPPNLEAMQAMAQRIMPLLKMRGIRAKVLAVGRHPPQEPLHEDIIFTGPVEQVAPYLLAADMAVVPLLKGGGTRMKILDYFAAGLPVVSTAKGIEGIPVTVGVHALVTEDADEAFAAAIADLVNDPQRAAELGKQGRIFVEQMDWNAIARRYIDLMASK